MGNKTLTIIGSSIIAIALLSGCGSKSTSTAAKAHSGETKTSTTTSTSPTTTGSNKSSAKGSKTVSVGANQYQGKTNLNKYTAVAKKQSNNFQAQLSAGISEFQNLNYNQAIAYYKNAASINKKSAVPYNNIGNVYRTMKNLKSAMTNYTKATQVDPTYAYGWYNLALAQVNTGDKKAAKATIQQALKSVKTSDPLYSALKAEQASLNK